MEVFYVKAEVPDEHIQDARELFYGRFLKPKTPIELYNMVPIAQPTTGQTIKAVEGHKGVFEIDEKFYAKLPGVDWYRIFTFCGASAVITLCDIFVFAYVQYDAI